MKMSGPILAFFPVIALLALVDGCSSNQDLGRSGYSKQGETCSKSSDCVSGLRCLNAVCGGSGGGNVVSTGPVDGVDGGHRNRELDVCASDTQCQDPQSAFSSSRPYCKTGGSCTECTHDAHCVANSLGHYCKVTPAAADQNQCTECTADRHCANNPGGHACKVMPGPEEANRCTECNVDAQCTDPRAPRCSIGKSLNGCVECLGDVDCKDPTKAHCEVTTFSTIATSGYCHACLSNTHCLDPQKPICRFGSCDKP